MARKDDEFADELDNHLDLLTAEYTRRGMAPDDARREARVRLGGVTQLRETRRDQERARFVWLDQFVQDVRQAFRLIRRAPVFAAGVVLTLAIGIGANTAIFSVVYAVVLKPLPYPDAPALFNVFQASPAERVSGTAWSYQNYLDLRAQNDVFVDLAGAQHHQLTLTGHGDPTVVNVSTVTPELFGVLGTAPLKGRPLAPSDAASGAPPVTVLSESLWHAVFGSDEHIVGTTIDLDKHAFTIVGVMADTFRFPYIADSRQLWIPLAQDPLFSGWLSRRTGHWLQVTGRLKPGVTVAQAQASLDLVSARLASAYPTENRGWSIRMVPLQEMIVGDVRMPLVVLLGAIALVLLIACANLSNLLLMRATTRGREIAVRASLGAGRARIVRQLLTESAVLGVLGASGGLALAFWGIAALQALVPSTVPLVNNIQIDPAVLGFALAISAIASLAAGLAPALFAAHADLQTFLRDGGRGSTDSRRRKRMRGALAAGEVALAMVLLTSAGLLLRSFAQLVAVDPGFDHQRLVKAAVSLPRFQYPQPFQWTAFGDQLLAGLHAAPALRDSALAVPIPLADGSVNLGFVIADRPPAPASAPRTADYASVSPDYFRVMGIRLEAGRTFDERDIPKAARVTVISRALAQQYFPGEDPIGKRLVFSFPPDPGVPREIVGIVGDVRDKSLGQDPGAMMYVPFAQGPFWGAGVVVRSGLTPAGVASAIRREVAKIDPDLPVTDVAGMPDILQDSVAQPRFTALLLGVFGAMALVLAATGIFGVVSYSVARRTNEIGVRLALGASRGSILRLVLGETMWLAVMGLAVGVPCAIAASLAVRRLLFGVSAGDPLTVVAVAVTLAAVAAVAGYVPARRAMRVDPIVSLRAE